MLSIKGGLPKAGCLCGACQAPPPAPGMLAPGCRRAHAGRPLLPPHLAWSPQHPGFAAGHRWHAEGSVSHGLGDVTGRNWDCPGSGRAWVLVILESLLQKENGRSLSDKILGKNGAGLSVCIVCVSCNQGWAKFDRSDLKDSNIPQVALTWGGHRGETRPYQQGERNRNSS